MRALPLVAATLLATAPVAAGDPIFKWVDASGNVTYSSTPPPGAAAQPVDIPPAPPPAEMEAAKERERSLQELGDQLYQERADREAELAAERRAAREETAPPPTPRDEESGTTADGGWWIPAFPGLRPRPHPHGYRPVVPSRPVQPPARRDPTQPPDHPAFWPREPVLLPEERPAPRPRPLPLPPAR